MNKIKLTILEVSHSPILNADIYTIYGCPFVFIIEPEKILCLESITMKETGKWLLLISFYGLTGEVLSKHKSKKLAKKNLYIKAKQISESIMNALPEIKEAIKQ